MQPIVTLDDMMARFPNMKSKSAELAKGLLPIYPSAELAAIVAALMTDGHIDWYTSDGRPRTRNVILYSSKKEECEWFIDVCKRIFSIQGKVVAYEPKTGFFRKQPYKAVINNATLAMILILAGVPAGNKTMIPYGVPEWIIKGDDRIKMQFLRFFFNFEGSVPNKKADRPCSWQMGIHVCKKPELVNDCKEFLEQIINMLSVFGISCSSVGVTESRKKLGKNPIIRFSINNQKSIVNFHRKIGFYSHDKNQTLKMSVDDIAKNGRISSDGLANLLVVVKGAGTDKELLSRIALLPNTVDEMAVIGSLDAVSEVSTALKKTTTTNSRIVMLRPHSRRNNAIYLHLW